MESMLPNSLFTLKDGYPLVVVRQMNPFLGYYPTVTVNARNAIYLIHEGTPVIITRLYKNEAINDAYTSELLWLLKEEVRLLTALSIGRQYGWFTFVLDQPPIPIEFNRLVETVGNPRFSLSRNVDEILRFANERMRTPLKGERNWNDTSNVEWGSFSPFQIYNAIDPNDHVLMRCLFYWMKASMLSAYQPFQEEATSNLFYALDGLVKLFQEELKSNFKSASVKDVFPYLTSQYKVPSGYEEYVRMCYDKRTDYVHPSNHLDYSWVPRLTADDMLETFEVLRDLLYIYITGDESLEKAFG